jgi:hypothetical protein
MTVFSTSETSALVALISSPANGMDFAVFGVIDTAIGTANSETPDSTRRLSMPVIVRSPVIWRTKALSARGDTRTLPGGA